MSAALGRGPFRPKPTEGAAGAIPSCFQNKLPIRQIILTPEQRRGSIRGGHITTPLHVSPVPRRASNKI